MVQVPGCKTNFYYFIGAMAVLSILGSTSRVGNVLVALRCVEVRDKALYQLAVERSQGTRGDSGAPRAKKKARPAGRAASDQQPPRKKKAQAPPAGSRNPVHAVPDRASQICWLFQEGRCTEPCPNGRRHAFMPGKGSARGESAGAGGDSSRGSKGKGKGKASSGGKR